MKCDARDCNNEATHFEVIRASLTYYYKWCEKCRQSLEADRAEWGSPHELEYLSENEYIVEIITTS
jgi:hypothetical protein